jgi:hypothetical protein
MKQAAETPIAIGELIDKITILEIEVARFTDPTKTRNARAQLELLAQRRERAIPQSAALAKRSTSRYGNLKTQSVTASASPISVPSSLLLPGGSIVRTTTGLRSNDGLTSSSTPRLSRRNRTPHYETVVHGDVL